MATEVNRPQGRDEILDAVLDAAEQLFTASGPFEVSLRAIAQAAGVNYGLVHRHFGTKDALFERLLQRYADRWAERMEELDYQGALDELLGADPETGAYVRLLAWTLLSDRETPQSDAHRRYATLDQLPVLAATAESETVADSNARKEATAAALAFAFGWRFFNPFIRDALHMPADPADLQAAMRSYLHGLASDLPETKAH
jgi:TetR/AcrR family transcriptional regulator, repressor for neighboring sulfatase